MFQIVYELLQGRYLIWQWWARGDTTCEGWQISWHIITGNEVRGESDIFDHRTESTPGNSGSEAGNFLLSVILSSLDFRRIFQIKHFDKDFVVDVEKLRKGRAFFHWVALSSSFRSMVSRIAETTLLHNRSSGILFSRAWNQHLSTLIYWSRSFMDFCTCLSARTRFCNWMDHTIALAGPQRLWSLSEVIQIENGLVIQNHEVLCLNPVSTDMRKLGNRNHKNSKVKFQVTSRDLLCEMLNL